MCKHVPDLIDAEVRVDPPGRASQLPLMTVGSCRPRPHAGKSSDTITMLRMTVASRRQPDLRRVIIRRRWSTLLAVRRSFAICGGWDARESPQRPSRASAAELVIWYRRRDSNPHEGVDPQRILSPRRLPFRHSGLRQ